MLSLFISHSHAPRGNAYGGYGGEQRCRLSCRAREPASPVLIANLPATTTIFQLPTNPVDNFVDRSHKSPPKARHCGAYTKLIKKRSIVACAIKSNG